MTAEGRRVGRVSVLAGGDVFADLSDGRASFAPLTGLLAAADIVVGNCEGVYSDRPQPSPSHKHFMAAAAERGAFFGELGFDVMTCANNHIVDGGYVGLADTLELLRGQQIAVTGAGPTLADALRPAVVQRNDVSVAFVSFCSVFPVGYEARAQRPGLAALRVETTYRDPDRNFWEPAMPPAVTTAPIPADLASFRGAITAARDAAQFVVVACHWGISGVLELLQEYEIDLARDAVDHGADVVLCHHHHSLRGIELRGGRPIYYGLGSLVHHFDRRAVDPRERARRVARFGPLASYGPNTEFPLFPFAPDARMTGLALLDLTPGGSIEAGFIPAEILADGATRPLPVGSPRAEEVMRYVERITQASGFATGFERAERDGWSYLRVASGD